MTAPRRECVGESETPRRPSLVLVVAIAIAAVAGAAGAVVLRLNSEHAGSEPGLQIALLDWIVLSYVFSGLVAWWRRPGNRFGPLMIAGGFLTLLSCLSSARRASADRRPGGGPAPVRGLPARLPGLPQRPAARSGRAAARWRRLRDRRRPRDRGDDARRVLSGNVLTITDAPRSGSDAVKDPADRPGSDRARGGRPPCCAAAQ